MPVRMVKVMGAARKIVRVGQGHILNSRVGSKPQSFGLSMVKIRKFAESGGHVTPPSGAHGRGISVYLCIKFCSHSQLLDTRLAKLLSFYFVFIDISHNVLRWITGWRFGKHW